MDRIDRCNACGEVVPRRTLAMMRRKFAIPEGQNLLPYSEYNTSGWTQSNGSNMTASQVGFHPDGREIKYNSNQVVAGSPLNLFYSTTAIGATNIVMASTLTGISSYDSLCFSLYVGQPHNFRNSTTSWVVEPGALSVGFYVIENTTLFITFDTWVLGYGNGRVFTVLEKSLLADSAHWANGYLKLGFEITTDVGTMTDGNSTYYNACVWEHAQVEGDVDVPGKFIKTVGTAITRSVDTHKTEVVKVCPKCRERLVEDWELRGVPIEDADPSIPFFGGS